MASLGIHSAREIKLELLDLSRYSIVASQRLFDEIPYIVININNVSPESLSEEFELYNSGIRHHTPRRNNATFTNIQIDGVDRDIYIYLMNSAYFKQLPDKDKFIIGYDGKTLISNLATDLMDSLHIDTISSLISNSGNFELFITNVINAIKDRNINIFDLNYTPPRSGGKRTKKRKTIKRKTKKRKSIKRKSKKRRYTK